MQAFIKGHAFFIGVAMSFLLLSILCRFMTGVLLKKLLKEAENMSATENKLLKQCKLKFQNCYELNGGAVNVEVFVGKFMQNIKMGKCSLRLIGQLSGQMLLISVFAEGIGACIGIIHGETLGDVLPYYLLAFLSLYLYFSISGLIDVQGKQEALKTTVMDFLENRMKGRIVSVKQDSEYLDEVEKAALLKKQGTKVKQTEVRASEERPEEDEAAATEAACVKKTEARTAETKAAEAKGLENRAEEAEIVKTGMAEVTVFEGKPDGRARGDAKEEKEELEALLGEFLA